SSRRRHTRCYRDWSSDVCSSDLFVARLMILTDLRCSSGRNGVTSKSLTSAPILTGWRLASNDRIGPTPLTPSRHAVQNASLPTQIGRASCRERGEVSLGDVYMKE